MYLVVLMGDPLPPTGIMPLVPWWGGGVMHDPGGHEPRGGALPHARYHGRAPCAALRWANMTKPT